MPEPGFLAKSGEYRECASDYGAYDTVGNLHEWVSDTVDRRLPLKLPLRDDIRDKIRVNTGKGIRLAPSDAGHNRTASPAS